MRTAKYKLLINEKKNHQDLNLGETNVNLHWTICIKAQCILFSKLKEADFYEKSFSVYFTAPSGQSELWQLELHIATMLLLSHTIHSSRSNCRNCLNKKYWFHWVANATSFLALRRFSTAWWTLWRMCSTSWLSTYSSCSSLLWWQCSSSRVASFTALMSPKSLSVTAGQKVVETLLVK